MKAPTRFHARSWQVSGLALVLILTVFANPGLAAGTWFKVAGGISGLAMDDINNSTFRFYDTSVNGYDLSGLNSGFSLSFHLGADISEKLAFGFSWDIQHAHVEGTDVDVAANLELDANLFMGHAYWTMVRGQKFSLGAAGGMGLVAANGTVKINADNVNYGEGKTSGTNLAAELMGTAEYALADNKALQLTAGWRLAEVGTVDFEGTTVQKDDGSNLTLDYSGYTIKLGLLWRFGDGSSPDGDDIK